MKLILLKPRRLLFDLGCCLVCLYKMWTALSGSYPMAQHILLSWPKSRPWFWVHEMFLPSFPLQSETPGMVFLFPCLRLPYASYAEAPNDITKITFCAVISGALCEAPLTGVPLSWAVLWVHWSHLLSPCSGWEPSIICVWVTLPSVCCALPFLPPTPSILQHTEWIFIKAVKVYGQPHFLRCFQCLFCWHRRFSALAPPLSGKLQQMRAERGTAALWAGGRGSGPSDTAPRLSPFPNPVPTHGTSLALCSQPVSIQCSQQEQLQVLCCRKLWRPCSAAGGGGRGPPVPRPLLGATCAFQRGFASLKPHGWQFQHWGSTVSCHKHSWLWALSGVYWLGFQYSPSLLLPSPQQANHALPLVEIVYSKTVFLALSETS